MAKAKRSEAQKRATAKMLAANKAKRSAAGKSTSHSHAKRSGSRPAAKAPNVSVTVKAPATPAAKRPASRAGKAKASAGRALKMGKELMHDVAVPALVGGGMASIVDVAYGAARVFLPDAVADHPVAKPLIKLGAGIGGAMLLQKFKVLKPAQAKAAAVGVGAVQVHSVLNGLVKDNTSLNLNGVGMTLGELHAVLPGGHDLNGLESLGSLLVGDQTLGSTLPFVVDGESREVTELDGMDDEAEYEEAA